MAIIEKDIIKYLVPNLKYPQINKKIGSLHCMQDHIGQVEVFQEYFRRLWSIWDMTDQTHKHHLIPLKRREIPQKLTSDNDSDCSQQSLEYAVRKLFLYNLLSRIRTVDSRHQKGGESCLLKQIQIWICLAGAGLLRSRCQKWLDKRAWKMMARRTTGFHQLRPTFQDTSIHF